MSITRREMIKIGVATAAAAFFLPPWLADKAQADEPALGGAQPLTGGTQDKLYMLVESQYYYLVPSDVASPNDYLTYEGYGYTTYDSTSHKIDVTATGSLVALIELQNYTTLDTFYTTSSTVAATYVSAGYTQQTWTPGAGYVSTTATGSYIPFYRAYNATFKQNCFGDYTFIIGMGSGWTKYTTTPQFYIYS